MNADAALVCTMDVFTPAQRESHIRVTTQLFESVQRVREVKNGYEFVFPNEAELIPWIAEFISNERLCCSFLKFTLHVQPDGDPISLQLTGPDGTQEFLQLEFSGVLS